MKRIIYLLILLLISNSALALELEGGIKFDVPTAREYVQEGQANRVKFEGPYRLQVDNVERVVYSRNNIGEVIALTVLYKGEPDKTYIYNPNHKLIYFEKYDKSVNIYPHRGYRYDLKGKLVLTSLTVSKNEMFRFDPNGNLLAHSINGVIYDENGQIIGTGK